MPFDEDRKREVAVTIAHRAAMRVLPDYWQWALNRKTRKGELTALAVLRCNLTSGVAAKMPTHEVKRAATATATDAAAYAADAAVWESVRADCQAVKSGDDPMKQALWLGPDAPPARLWPALKPDLLKLGSEWSFWIDWYQSAHDGTPLDWTGKLKDIALIDDEVWKDGAKAVAEAIAKIEARYRDGDPIGQAIRKTPYGERIEINPDTGRLQSVPDSDLADDLEGYVARKIAGAVALFGDEPANQHTALIPELDLLRVVLTVEPCLPIELFDACASTSNRIRVRVENGELPEPEKDPLLADFLKRIRDAGADVFGNDEKTRAMVAARNAVLGNNALTDGREEVIAGVDELEPVVEGALRNDMPIDAETATDKDADADERERSGYRLVSRVVRIAGIVVTGGIGLAAAIAALADSTAFNALLKVALKYIGF